MGIDANVETLWPIEREEVINRARGMRDDEKRLTLQHLPTGMIIDELQQRHEGTLAVLNAVCAAIASVNDNMTLDELADKVREIRAIVEG